MSMYVCKSMYVFVCMVGEDGKTERDELNETELSGRNETEGTHMSVYICV